MDWLMKVFQNIDTLPVLLMNHLWSREQKWYRVTQHFNSFHRNSYTNEGKNNKRRKGKGKQVDVVETNQSSETASTVSYLSQTPSRIEALVHFKRGTVDHGCDNQFRVYKETS